MTRSTVTRCCVTRRRGLEEGTGGTLAFRSFMILLKATREASSTQTWTYSQPTPRLCSGPCDHR